MFPEQIPVGNPEEYSRCEEPDLNTQYGKSLSAGQKKDATIRESIGHSLWRDEVLRANEYDEIEIQVRNGIVYLSGHIVNASSKGRIETALRTVPDIQGIQNSLVLDDKLTREVAAALGRLEHTYACKFFTGASHGVVSINGTVNNKHVKLLAEKYAASNPNVRAVINNVRIAGDSLELTDQPFLQPTIGELIYFLDGVSGIVKQVIMDPNNRRVLAMIIDAKFAHQHAQTSIPNNGKTHPPENLVVVPIGEVRFLTRSSGFLHIKSTETIRYIEFNPTYFVTPKNGWKAPHPYCPADVLFPVENQESSHDTSERDSVSPLIAAVKEKEELHLEPLLANDSLGG